MKKASVYIILVALMLALFCGCKTGGVNTSPSPTVTADITPNLTPSPNVSPSPDLSPSPNVTGGTATTPGNTVKPTTTVKPTA